MACHRRTEYPTGYRARDVAGTEAAGGTGRRRYPKNAGLERGVRNPTAWELTILLVAHR